MLWGLKEFGKASGDRIWVGITNCGVSFFLYT